MLADRTRVYLAIDGERDYQDAQRGNAARHEGMPGRETMHPAELILYMEKCLADARTEVYRGTTGAKQCLKHVRRVAALAVYCMELHGAPRREDEGP